VRLDGLALGDRPGHRAPDSGPDAESLASSVRGWRAGRDRVDRKVA
jgi:hypothetical protein